MTKFDQRKAGLQDDHDPHDPAQKQNDKPKGGFKPSRQPSAPDEKDQFPPGDESKFG
jgi:hypothetical protein